MFTAFSTALSALDASTTAIDVVSNNLANLNTTGYKASAVAFRDLVTQSLGSGLGETQVGFGTGTPYTTREFTQGPTESSTGLLDGAISGDGFFIVKNDLGANEYTRAGNFTKDSDGNLLTQSGEHVQGWTAGADGKVNTDLPIGDIIVPVGTLRQPQPTKTFSYDLNLDASTAVGGSYTTPALQVVDSLGVQHNVTVTFTRVNDNPSQWTYAVNLPDGTVSSPAGTPTTIQFDANGKLDTTTSPTSVEVDVTGLTDNASPLTMNWNLLNSVGAPRITQIQSPSSPSANAQDGVTAASLSSVSLGAGGQILAGYSDGTQAVVGQLALASIRNPETLIAVGNNNFEPSANTALPSWGLPSTSGRGDIMGGRLESSTVDIAKEFTNLIEFERYYQANSRVVTTVDQISQETINLKQ